MIDTERGDTAGRHKVCPYRMGVKRYARGCEDRRARCGAAGDREIAFTFEVCVEVG